jgi:hypothetical protein
MNKSKFLRWAPEDDGAWLSVSGKTYWCIRAGKTARFPPAGCASIMSDSGNRRRPIKFKHVPTGNLMHDLIEGNNIEPTARKFIVIVFSDKDWQKMEGLKRRSLRLFQGGKK